MRLPGFIISLLLAVSPALGAEPAVMPLHDEPRPVPTIEFMDGDGKALTLDDWRGKVVLLNIWATWCPPCRHEMPTLDRLQSRLGSDRFEVLALSIDRAGVGAVRAFFDEIGVRHLRLVIDESGATARALGAFGLPTTLLIGPDGRELGRLVGPAEWDTPEMIAFFEKTLLETGKEPAD